MNLGSTTISGSGGLTLMDTLPITGLTALIATLTVGAIRVIKLR